MSDLQRGCPKHAIGGGARKDHLFRDGRSLCHRYMYGGGRPITKEDIDADDEELCKECLREITNGE